MRLAAATIYETQCRADNAHVFTFFGSSYLACNTLAFYTGSWFSPPGAPPTSPSTVTIHLLFGGFAEAGTRPPPMNRRRAVPTSPLS